MKHRKYYILTLWLVAICLSLPAIYVTFIDRGYTEVCFVDVGQGDACFIKGDGGENILIDGGDDGSGDYVLESFLRKKFALKLDAVFISHFHSDHTEGIYELIDKGVKIKKIYVSDTAHNEKGYDALADRAKAKNIQIKEVSDEESLDIGNLRFHIVATGSREGLSRNVNDNSVILRMDYGDNSFLFTGDATKKVEGELVNDKDVDVDFLKVGHHGSHTSSGKEFIEAVSPDYSIISVGEKNKYNHPSEKTLATLEGANTSVIRTDRSGTITIMITEDGINKIDKSREGVFR